ncbi:MAG: Acyl-CoA dehydrogenase [Nitrospira sp.]|jgi:alkylation response protein AidB-like acyl-CoA dehydrogenase|nr:MAG: Acyl-CoA dehydrogenase [Nitrospira sp.]
MSTLFKGFERIEEARERFTGVSFMTGLYDGRPDFDLLLTPPEPPDEKAAGEAFCKQVELFLRHQVDPEEIERHAKIPESVIQGLFALGAFGMKIPKAYGGLGFSYTNYGRVLTLIAGWSNILALTVAVPQSIGIAMPILLYGNEDQKKKYLPLVAKEALSAFALTEPMTGSDAANVRTEAVLDATGSHFLVNGEKLWCTNGPIARYATLIARVPAKKVERDGTMTWVPVPNGQGANDRVHTAFILDMSTPGALVRHRCRFEGCRGIENAHLTLENVRIPVEHVIGDIGKGLKYALTILNVGRGISIPAICLGMAKQAWQPTLDRTNTRLTFQKPLAERQTQQIRIGDMAGHLYAMEALSMLVWRMADHHRYDIRIEAAMAKIFCSEHTIRFLRDAQIIFGGMGYETADSKKARGEAAFGIEQLVRDAEMYRIGEGATDILRPFVVREGLNRHLELAKGFYADGLSILDRIGQTLKLVRFYLPWYLRQWRKRPLPNRSEFAHLQVGPLTRYVERTSRRLAREVLYAMVRFRASFQDEQRLQNRIEAVGEDLFAMLATVLYAESQTRVEGRTTVWELVDAFCTCAKQRIEQRLTEFRHHQDHLTAATGTQALKGYYPTLSEGIIHRRLDDYVGKHRSS